MRSKESGLTLVEIIVVLVILSILVAFLTGSLFSQGDKAKAQINQLRMEKVKSYIQSYQLQYNALPSSMDDLTRCNERTGPSCIPQVSDLSEIADAWGTPFVYATDSRAFSLRSLGADRREGGDGVNSDFTIQGP